jgi:hypothetical protein
MPILRGLSSWNVRSHRPLRISKFGTSLSAMHPELPSNKWARALSRPWIISRRPPNRDRGRQASAFEDRAGTGNNLAADSASNGPLLDGQAWVAPISDADHALGGALRASARPIHGGGD